MSRPQNELNLAQTLKIAYFCNKKLNLNQIKLKARIEGDIENKLGLSWAKLSLSWG